jgi:predicted alpha/beta hydrolase
VAAEDLEIRAADGFELAATAFEAAGPSARPPVVVLSATGVPRAYYARFAAFLAGEGFPALTLDYRGISGSRPASLRSLSARMQDWAELDAAAAIELAGARWCAERVLIVGHSFGGQAVGLVPRPERIGGALLVAAQSGYWGHWRGAARPGMWLLWHAVIPILSRAFGWFPSRRLGLGEDLPSGVARQWAAWGRRPGYVIDGLPSARESFARVRAPIRSISFGDDAFAPRAAVDALAAFYSGAAVERVHLQPFDLGVRSVGHFGYFRESFSDSLWRDAQRFLLEAASARAA